MKYEKIRKAEFIERPNRFVALVRLKEEQDIGSAGSSEDSEKGSGPAEEKAGQIVRVHVKNTGRCRELLVPGAEVILEDFRDRMGTRKMEYSIVAVRKGDLLINMDSYAPNLAVGEMLEEGRLRLPALSYPLSLIKPEARYGDSRLDFYVEDAKQQKAYIEVKGVTLEEDGIVRFPDAPTERGTKHLRELQKAAAEGFNAYVIFVVQMERADHFEPNRETDPAFADELARAADSGVKILAYTCCVEPDKMSINSPLGVKL